MLRQGLDKGKMLVDKASRVLHKRKENTSEDSSNDENVSVNEVEYETNASQVLTWSKDESAEVSESSPSHSNESRSANSNNMILRFMSTQQNTTSSISEELPVNVSVQERKMGIPMSQFVFSDDSDVILYDDFETAQFCGRGLTSPDLEEESDSIKLVINTSEADEAKIIKTEEVLKKSSHGKDAHTAVTPLSSITTTHTSSITSKMVNETTKPKLTLFSLFCCCGAEDSEDESNKLVDECNSSIQYS